MRENLREGVAAVLFLVVLAADDRHGRLGGLGSRCDEGDDGHEGGESEGLALQVRCKKVHLAEDGTYELHVGGLVAVSSTREDERVTIRVTGQRLNSRRDRDATLADVFRAGRAHLQGRPVHYSRCEASSFHLLAAPRQRRRRQMK